jgi:hypothetical protein
MVPVEARHVILPVLAMQLLAELHMLPLYKLVSQLLERAPSSGCGDCSTTSKPFFAERLTMLLLLIPLDAWDALPKLQVGGRPLALPPLFLLMAPPRV